MFRTNGSKDSLTFEDSEASVLTMTFWPLPRVSKKQKASTETNRDGLSAMNLTATFRKQMYLQTDSSQLSTDSLHLKYMLRSKMSVLKGLALSLVRLVQNCVPGIIQGIRTLQLLVSLAK